MNYSWKCEYIKEVHPELYKLGFSNPVVHRYLYSYFNDDITLEECLSECIQRLCKINDEQYDALYKQYSKQKSLIFPRQIDQTNVCMFCGKEVHATSKGIPIPCDCLQKGSNDGKD